MIEFKDVTYTYANRPEPAVKGVTFSVSPGEVKVITGASGCGKTTLMRLVNGLAPHLYEGSIRGGITVAGLTPEKSDLVTLSGQIGTLFQDPEEQFFALNVYDEIAFTLKSRGLPEETVREKILSTAAQLGIEGILGSDIHALSEGQKQKVGLASLLVFNPGVLVLDEPSANLDPESTGELAALLRMLKAQGKTILVVDHRLYWLRDVADEVLVMKAGRIVARGPWDILSEEKVLEENGLRSPLVRDVRETLPRIEVTHGGYSARAETVFAVKALSFAYPGRQPFFENCGFGVSRGITALIGGNGQGKTTLARILTGLNKAEGEFFFRNTATDGAGLLQRVGLVLQNADHQLQMRTVGEEIAIAAAAGRALKSGRRTFPSVAAVDRDSAQHWMQALNLSELSGRHPQSLSGGEKQRLVIACAMAKEPDILILDEPTSGLDGNNMRTIGSLLRHISSRGVAVFLITHDLELLNICDAALHMNDLRKNLNKGTETHDDV